MRNIYTEQVVYKVKPKEITIRVEPEEWERIDDKRHSSRETWQSIGLKLFRSWLAGEEKPEDSTKAKEIPEKELTQTVIGAYSQSSELHLGKFLGKLLEKYGIDAVDLLAEAVLRMPEVSLADLPEAEPPPLLPSPGETEDHPEVGRRVSRKRRAS
jgi:hypothetical protein